MKEFSKYVLYFGIVSLSIWCIAIFHYAIARASVSVPVVAVILWVFFLFGWPLIVIINIEIIFRLYKYDIKTNPLKNKKVLKILRFILYILYPLGTSVTCVYFIGFELLHTMVFYAFFIYIPGFLFVLVSGILIMCLYILNRIKKVHKILSPEPPVEDSDSQWITI